MNSTSHLSLRDCVATVLWYLRRPPLYLDFFRQVARLPKAIGSRATAMQIRENAQQWCAAHRSSQVELLNEIGIPPQIERVSEIYADEWDYALRSAAASPVKMGGAAHVDLLYHLCVHLRAERVVETGVAYGWSSLALLLALARNGGGTLVSIDRPYLRQNNDQYVGCVVPASLRSQWTLVRKPDRDALPGVLRNLGELDLAHYDSDKSHAGRTFAYNRIWTVLRPGGILVSDDIGDNFGFREFAERVGRRPWILPKEGDCFVGILVK